jgi:hypothetical protein
MNPGREGIVEESLAPEASVAEVARQYDVHPTCSTLGAEGKHLMNLM